MFRSLLTTTALAALMTAGAIAQDQNANPPPADQQQEQPADPNAAPPPADQQQQEQQAQEQSQEAEQVQQDQQQQVQSLLAKGYQVVDEDNLATEIIGMAVYSGPNDDAERIGDVNNFVITENGQVAAVIIGVGGFLGIGEKNVAVDYRELQKLTDGNGELRLVLATTKDALEQAPDFRTVDNDDAALQQQQADQAQVDQQQADQQTLEGNQAQQAQDQQLAQPADEAPQPAPADQQAQPAPADQNQQQAANPPPDRSQLTQATLTAEELIGANAYGPNNEHLGDIGDMVLAEDGKTVEAVIIDFGGFLGMGRKEVAVAMDNLQFYTDQNGNRYVYVNVTRDQLDQARDFDKNTFAQNRDAMLLRTEPAPQQ